MRGSRARACTGLVTGQLVGEGIGFVGRIDRQVKIRGYRIEPGEIEAALSRNGAVAEAVVAACAVGGGDARLVAYYVGRDGEGVTAADLRAFLGRHLPQFMVPSAFVRLDTLPLLRNGKVDMAALPNPFESSRPEGPESAVQGGQTPPSGPGRSRSRASEGNTGPGLRRRRRQFLRSRRPFPACDPGRLANPIDHGHRVAAADLLRQPYRARHRAGRRSDRPGGRRMRGGGVMRKRNEDPGAYRVVVNDSNEHSIWPAGRPLPGGWTDAQKEGSRAECLAHVERIWRPDYLCGGTSRPEPVQG